MITIIFWIQHPVVARSFCCFVLYQFLSSFSFCCYPKHEDAPSYCSVCFYFNKCIEVYCCVWLSMVVFFGPPASMFVGRGRSHQWKWNSFSWCYSRFSIVVVWPESILFFRVVIVKAITVRSITGGLSPTCYGSVAAVLCAVVPTSNGFTSAMATDGSAWMASRLSIFAASRVAWHPNVTEVWQQYYVL